MSKRKCTFKENDVKRACQAAEMAGKKISRLEIDRAGTIILVVDNGATDTAKSQDSNSLDNWMAAHADATKGY